MYKIFESIKIHMYKNKKNMFLIYIFAYIQRDIEDAAGNKENIDERIF